MTEAAQQGLGSKDSSQSGDYSELWKHHHISRLVRRTKEYIVHVDSERHRLDWETSSLFDQNHESCVDYDKNKYNAVLCDVAVLEARPCLGLDENITTEFRVLLGEALVCAFEDDYETAGKMIAAATTYFDARSQEKSRLWYLAACLWAAGPCTLSAVIFAIFKDSFSLLLGDAVYWSVLAACAGAIGALFSVILRIGRLSVDCASGKNLHDLEAFSRILAGAISGTFVAIAYNSGIFFPAIVNSDKSHYALILLAMISGIAERSAVSLIAKFQAEKLGINTNERDF